MQRGNGTTNAPAARQDSPELVRARETNAKVEQGVNDAIAARDWDLAFRLAPGAHDAAFHVSLMDRIHAAKAAVAKVPDAPLEAPADAPPKADAGSTDEAPSWRAFHLARADVEFLHLNVRTKREGTDDVPWCDLKFRTKVGNDRLAMFDPALRDALFYKSGDPQDLHDATHPAPNLRLPHLAPVEWTRALIGAQLTVHLGASERGSIVFDGCEVDGFVIQPFEGGTCAVTFTVKRQRPDGAAVGKLVSLVKRSGLTVSVKPPESGWHVEEEGGGEDE